MTAFLWATLTLTDYRKAPVHVAASHSANATPIKAAVRTERRPTTVRLSESSAPKLPSGERICSVNVVEWDLSKTLRLLSDETGVNMVLLSPAGAKLTLRLNNVRLKDMVRHLCAVSSLTYLDVDGTYIFATDALLKAGYPSEYKQVHPESPPPEPKVAKPTDFVSYHPRGADPERLANTLYAMFKNDKLSVVTGVGSELPAALSADLQMDPSMHIGDTTVSAATATSAPGEPNGTGLRIAGGGRTILLYGDTDVVQRALEAAKALDIVPQQVVIQVSVYEISNDAAKNLGITWNFGKISFSEAPSGINLGTLTRTGINFEATIAALETAAKARTLAQPNLSAMDGTVSSILIGQQLNFPNLVGYSNANTPIFSTKEVDAGISLQVSPLIGDDGLVTMLIRPSVSTVTGFLQVNGASYPQLSTRKAQATVRVRSGETIVLGGLMNSQDIENIQRTPILSKIPIFGELFKSRSKTRSDSQLVITITPKILPRT